MAEKACINWILFAALAGALAPVAGCRRAPPFSGDWRGLRHGERGGRGGFVDGSGHWAIKPRFVEYGEFSEGFAWAAEKGTAYGYIDKTGAWAIRPRFRHATEFSERLAAVAQSLRARRRGGGHGRRVEPRAH